MKSYSETINERAREVNARADAGLDITMHHLNINTGEAKMPAETDVERKERTGLSSLEIGDAEAAAVQKTRFRVSLELLNSKIINTEYIYPVTIPHMTICILMVDNGFALVGKSAPGDEQNYDEALGKKFAREDAIRQMWVLEGYLMRERMML